MGQKQDSLKWPKIRLILLILFLSATEILGVRQAIMAFKGYKCSGEYVIFYDTVDINETSWVKEAPYFIIVGLWKITASREVISEETTTETPEIVYTENIFAKPRSSDYYCFDLYDLGFSNFRYNFTRFERFGPAEPSTSTLMLFSEMNLKGEWDTVNDELGHVLSKEIQCFAQFSDKHWIYYPEASFQGEPQCLCGYYDWWLSHTTSLPMGFDGVQYFNTHKGIKIGSVKVDKEEVCDCPYSRRLKPSTTPYTTRTTTKRYYYKYPGFDYNYLYFLFLLIIPFTCVIYCCCKQTTFARREIVIKFGTGPPPPPPTRAGMGGVPLSTSNSNSFTPQTNMNQNGYPKNL